VQARHSDKLPEDSESSVAWTNAQLLAMFQLADDVQTKQKFLHMDLKPDNLLYDTPELFTLLELVLNDFTFSGSLSKEVRQVKYMDLFTGKQTFHIPIPTSEGFSNNKFRKCQVLVDLMSEAFHRAMEEEVEAIEAKAQNKRTEQQLEDYQTKLLEEYVKVLSARYPLPHSLQRFKIAQTSMPRSG